VDYGRLRLRTSHIVMANTVGISHFAENLGWLSKDQSRRETKNRELAVMLATFHRIGPLAGLTIALVATFGWIGLLGYLAIKLF